MNGDVSMVTTMSNIKIRYTAVFFLYFFTLYRIAHVFRTMKSQQKQQHRKIPFTVKSLKHAKTKHYFHTTTLAD